MAMAAIFLASKMEENPRRPRDILNVFHRMEEIRSGSQTHQPLDYTKQVRHLSTEKKREKFSLHQRKTLLTFFRIVRTEIYQSEE
jgi:hypothetical protein